MKGDLHIHSTFSDGKLPIPAIVDLYGKAGFDVIAITDHLCEENTFLGKAAHLLHRTLTRANFPLYREIIKSEQVRAWDLYRMILIPGFEITKNSIDNHDSYHFLGLGIEEYISADDSIESVTQKIHNHGGVTIAAHPVSTKKFEKQTYGLWDNKERYLNCFDAWEVASGPYLFEDVVESGLPIIANSDFHHIRQLESWKTYFSCSKNSNAVLDTIKNQNLEIFYYGESRYREYTQAVFRPEFNH